MELHQLLGLVGLADLVESVEGVESLEWLVTLGLAVNLDWLALEHQESQDSVDL